MSRSFMHLAHRTPSLLSLLLLGVLLTACVSQPPIYLAANPCFKLIPESWKVGVSAANLPVTDSAGEWVALADANAGQIDIANNRFRDAMKIIADCEARDAAVVESMKPKPWYHLGIW